MLLPGTDPVTMLIEMVPLLVLFEVSLIAARMFGGRRVPPSATSPSPSPRPAGRRRPPTAFI